MGWVTHHDPEIATEVAVQTPRPVTSVHCQALGLTGPSGPSFFSTHFTPGFGTGSQSWLPCERSCVGKRKGNMKQVA